MPPEVKATYTFKVAFTKHFLQHTDLIGIFKLKIALEITLKYIYNERHSRLLP